jgi:Domain of unknown function (DUF1918)
MRALPGDRVLIKERRAGEGDREAVILEVWSEQAEQAEPLAPEATPAASLK